MKKVTENYSGIQLFRPLEKSERETHIKILMDDRLAVQDLLCEFHIFLRLLFKIGYTHGLELIFVFPDKQDIRAVDNIQPVILMTGHEAFHFLEVKFRCQIKNVYVVGHKCLYVLISI